VRLAELIGTLSLATDAGTGAPEEMGLRSAIASAKLAAAAGLSSREQSDAFYLALLRYTGCTSEGELASAMFGDEIEFGVETFGMDYGDARQVMPAVLRNARKRGGVLAMAGVLAKMPKMPAVMRAHCEVADLLARGLGFDETFRAALVQNNERWNGSGMPNKLEGEAIALPMRVAHVGQDIAVGFKLGGVEGARARVASHAKKGLDPALVEKVTADVIEALDAPSIWRAFLDAEPSPHKQLSDDALDDALITMAAFADMKSRYTRGHSTAVSALAEAAAKQIGLPDDVVRDVRRAGLLHDLGRVAIAAGIWDKAKPLTDSEREKIRLHTYVGERVLSRAPSLAAVAEIACLAHERLDGGGYHRRLSASSCPPAARILAVADVYCALTEERPHRAAMSPADAAAELTKMAGGLCPDATRAVLAAAGHVVKKVDREHGLTDREVEVLRLLARGLTNKEIANALDISTKTAGHHVQAIFGKLGVTTRAAAAICAMSKGIAQA
jgi:HD-GYP domain-containing protein (c-di-GMP phosphodiesterase class II)